MNANTKQALIDYIYAINELAYAVSNVCGTQTVAVIVEQGEILESALERDETLFEVS